MSTVIPNFTGKSIDAGRLQMLEPVGAGTSGSVYLAIDHHASTSSGPVRRAIKVVQKAGPSARDVQHQLREFRIQYLVSDVPGVHRLLEVHEDEAYFYLVSDYRDCDLFHLIAEGIAFDGDDERIRSVFVQILDAVHGCHSVKVYHRDLKPGNILCTADGTEVSVADFGAATLAERAYPDGQGTNCYMSPECIGQDSPYWAKYADIWALGLILVNLITGGCHPWKEATQSDPDFCQFIKQEDYLEFELGISSDAADLLKRIFRADPTTRPSLAQIRNTVLRIDTFFGELEEDYAGDELDDFFAEFDKDQVEKEINEFFAQLEEDYENEEMAFAEFEEGYADDEVDEESDDGSEGSNASSASEAAKPIDISCFLGHKRPLLLPFTRTLSDDEFACGFIDGLEMLDFA